MDRRITGVHAANDIPYWRSYRLSLAIISFIGFIFVYVVRTNFSIAMVCMVKRPFRNSTSAMNETKLKIGNNTRFTEIDIEDEACSLVAQINDYTHGEFEWDRRLQGLLLSSFFYGYVVTQLPAGIMADKFGGKRVFGFGMLVTVVAMVLIPIGARFHISIVFICRVLMGLGTGVVFPAMHSMWGKWAPPLERSKLMTFCYSGVNIGTVLSLTVSGLLCHTGIDGGWPSIFYVSGVNIGTVLSLTVSGLLCHTGIDGGWPSIFYVSGGATFLWILLWAFFVFDTPRDHPRITDVERDYIESSIGQISTKKRKSIIVPWLELWKSKPLWAIITAHVCNNWGGYTLLTSLPTYMRDVLKFHIRSNGFLSALPYICMWLFFILGGQVADHLRKKQKLSTEATRKLFQTIAFLGAAIFMLATGFMNCERRYLAVAFLTIGVTLQGAGASGFVVNHVDIAPMYAGVLYGITNTAGTLSGIFSPMVVGVIAPNGTAAEWRTVFYICAGVYIFGLAVFLILAKGEVQPWATASRYTEENFPMDEHIQKRLVDKQDKTR
ncbi:unnamed protein product [Owenia fusiformis]|uniref:Major facilitator superfamily (MFS) profile domain-containing protein n=1 Tax=Owenia fusiformis TaxID=6347 RepID=A0A8S4Q9W9_OWEFU|nr:unnamed protein product [Owenia fusiformis]